MKKKGSELREHESKQLEAFWSKRYVDQNTGWDIGAASTPLKQYIDQIENKETAILIPGAGNAYEAEYLHLSGFTNVTVLDISLKPLANLQQRVSSFPKNHLVNENFFEHLGQYELILEQTFFCSFEPSKKNRTRYAKKMSELLTKKGKLVGLWFNIPLNHEGKRPFGGTKDEYIRYLAPYFEVQSFENCYNSIKPRSGNELFGIFKKK